MFPLYFCCKNRIALAWYFFYLFIFPQLSQIRDYQKSEIHPSQTDKPPPDVYVVGGSAVFHKYMYILYLLFKSKDKSCGGRGLVML